MHQLSAGHTFMPAYPGALTSRLHSSTRSMGACKQQLSMVGLLPDMPPGKTKFQTARTRKFRASALSEEDERTISHVEEFGCSVVNVTRTKYGLGWSYTVGVFDTSGKPEIITVGLPPETAHFALNEAAKLPRAGVDLTTGRHRDLIG